MPIDPINSASKKLFFLFACDPTSSHGFEFNAMFESKKFSEKAKNDEGDDPKVYEVGIIPITKVLNLIPKGFWENSF